MEERDRDAEERREGRGMGIARVNALSRCWSCLITSYQLKGKRRDAREMARARARELGKEEERGEIGLWRELRAFDCGDSEFLAELPSSLSLLLRPSLSLALSPSLSLFPA